MSAPATVCSKCGLSHSPVTESGLCLTCHTLEAPKLGLSNGHVPEAEATVRAAVSDIDAAELLDELGLFITRFQVLPSQQVTDLLALWVLHTHAFDAAWATPYLRITSAAPESGKTQLLEILSTLVRHGWHAVNPSVAVLYRKIHAHQPTLLLDEMDNYPVEERRDALSVLNAGYKRGATIDRCRENGDLESFSAYCPKAYAGLDKRQLVDTLLSRSITIRLEKRLPTEHVEMWIGQLTEPQADPLRERCEAWADQHTSRLYGARPELPAGMINRAAEVWWALLAIADLAGGDWPARARSAARALSTGGDDRDGRDVHALLLADIQAAFSEQDAITSAALLDTLNGLDESPWGARRRGEGLDARGLARELRPFGIKPRKVRVADKSLQGYQWEQFEDVFARHLPEAEHPEQAEQVAPGLEPDVPDVPDVPDLQPRPQDLVEGTVATHSLIEGATTATGGDDLSDLGPERPLPDPAAGALKPKRCGCAHPVPFSGEDGVSCAKCGHAVEEGR